MNLRIRLIRLAQTHPDLRADLIPLVKRAGMFDARPDDGAIDLVALPLAKQLNKGLSQDVDSVDPGGSISLDDGTVVFLTPGLKLGVTVSTPDYEAETMNDESKEFSWGIKLSVVARWVIQVIRSAQA